MDKQDKKTKKKNPIKPKEEKKETIVAEPEIREVIVEKKVGFNLLEVVIIMIITILFGFLIGSAVTYSKQAKTSNKELAGIPKDLQELVKTYEDILDNYYLDLDKQELLDAGIKGMIDFLDDTHSVYMDVKETQAFNEKVEGNYVGIGAVVSIKDGVYVISDLFASSPAYKAGLRKNDVLKEIDGKDISNLSISEVSSIIKGKKGTTVKLKVLRDTSLLDFVVVRDKVDIPSVSSDIFEVNNKKIGYLKIDIFASNTFKQVKKELTSLEDKNIDSLIVDVRDNPGGHLTQASEILSLFIEKGKILYQIETKGIKEPSYDWTKEKRTYPVSVLINENSASASEILAATMKEVYNASIVGVNSYGKGTVQKAFELQSGATIKYTTQKWLTPSGQWIEEVGVSPTEKIELDEEYYNNPSVDTDKQLQKAIELLSK